MEAWYGSIEAWKSSMEVWIQGNRGAWEKEEEEHRK